MPHMILWTDWVTRQLTDFNQYVSLLMSFVKTRFGGEEVEVCSEYQGPGSYRLKYWYNRPGGKPPLVKLDWEGV